MGCRWKTKIALAATFVALCSASLTAASARTLPADIAALADQLSALSPAVRREEASRLALHAHSASGALARRYRPLGPPQFHNFLVNAGIKKRGLCHHWARDLGDRLARLKLRTLELRWGIARAGTLREHNAVVVTARGQRFEEGIVLDAWRHSGRLFAGPVAGDKYPWKEDPDDSFVVARRSQR